jgi:hypothetical protein
MPESGSGSDGRSAADNDPNPARMPQIGVDASGNATVVWTQSDGARTSIAAGQYR